MAKDKKPLPKPPGTPFGRKRRFEEDSQDESLIADKMGMAMATGNLEKFMKEEFEGSDNAHKLASMMMGMSGMAPEGFTPQGASTIPEEQAASGEAASDETPPSGEAPSAPSGETPVAPPSEEVMKAAMSGDSKALSEMLKKEHLRRQGAGAEVSEEKPAEMQDPAAVPADEESQAAPEAAMEKEVLMKLMKIASENNVSIDWVINRALKLYVRDYEGTGRV
ncbi:MAG TPA: hypothetical protein ENI12_03020 [Nitrospirae bacterium]|nr:hypothetical protein [Nitrospirota bacterium]